MFRENRQKHLNLGLRGAIVGQHLAGSSRAQISRSLSVSTSTVERWISRFRDEDSLARRPQPGQIRKLDVFDMNDVVHRILDNPFTNAAVVGREFGVNKNTVRKVWNDVGLDHHIAAKKPFLTEANKEERLGFALQHINTDWSRYIFSDEKTFQTDRHQRLHLYRPKNCRYDEQYLQPNRRSGRISAGIWGWISEAGPGEMCLIDGRLNSVKYIEILDEVLMPSLNIVYPGENMIFMQDNHSVHNSIATRAWFTDHPQLEVLSGWPPNSPDLNPIENFWAEMTRDWENVYPRNLETLEPYIVENWEKMRGDTQYFRKLYESMPNRIRQVIDRNGAATSY